MWFLADPIAAWKASQAMQTLSVLGGTPWALIRRLNSRGSNGQRFVTGEQLLGRHRVRSRGPL